MSDDDQPISQDDKRFKIAFQEKMRENLGAVVIMAGSGSDEDHIRDIATHCRKYLLHVDVRICSAHKQPSKLEDAIADYNSVGGSYVIIAVAGGTDALSGTASFLANAPVISCPPDAENHDHSTNPSCVTNPPGSSNGYVARPANAARMAAQFYAGINADIREQLESERRKKIESLEKDDRVKGSMIRCTAHSRYSGE